MLGKSSQIIYNQSVVTNFITRGKFGVVNENLDSFKIGKTYSRKKFIDLERNRQHPKSEYIRGEVTVTAENSVVIIFNKDLLGWHYQWTSTKHTAEVFHEFKIVLCKETKSTTMSVLAVASSPHFQVVSRRRNRDNADSKAAEKKRKVTDDGNRTRDRIYQLATRFGNSFDEINYAFRGRDLQVSNMLNKLSSGEGHVSVATPVMVVDSLKENGISNASELMGWIGKVSMELLSLGRGNLATNRCFTKWTQGTSQFSAQCIRERDRNFSWNPMHEDETFVSGGELCENSIFAEFRQIFRDLVDHALVVLGLHLSMFHEMTGVASAHGFITLDPFYPPSHHEARFLHIQTRGSTDIMTPLTYSAGCKVFRTTDDHHAYAKDLLLLRRGIFRSVVLDRLKHVHSEMSLANHFSTSDSNSVLKPEFDMNGVWLDTELGKEEKTCPRICIDILQGGDFISQLFKQMFSKVKLTITNEVFVVEGQDVHLGSGKLSFQLDGLKVRTMHFEISSFYIET